MRVGVRAGLTVDHLVTVEAGATYSQLGGPGLYASLGARLVEGTTPVFLAGLPEDDPRFEHLFLELGIDVSAAPSVPTIPALWILNAPQGRRVVSVAPGEIELDGGAPMEAEEEPFPDLSDLGLAGLLLSSPSMEEIKVPPGAILGVDPDQARVLSNGWDYLEQVSRPGAIILPSRVQLRLINPNPQIAAAELADRLDCSVVARLDRDGMYIVHENRAWSLSDGQVRVEETTGAGDSSAAAIVAALSAGYDLPIAAAFGMSVARVALSGWGAHGLIHATPLSAPFSNIHIIEVSS